MRYYAIQITDPSSGQLYTPPGTSSALLGGNSYTSFVNGVTLPGALNIELDIPVIDAGTPQGFGLLRIWGISVAEIAQANNLIGKNIKIFGGMQKGLPLANPAQAGLLTSGYVYQCFGNWIGADMTLDFVIAPGSGSASNPGGPGTLAKPKNFTLNWQGGQPLGPALKQCLQTAFGSGYTVNVNINSGIVRPTDDTPVGFYSTLEQLSQVVRAMSLSAIKTTGYAGVRIVVNGTTVNAYDTPQGNATAIAFTDLVGQPTWIESPNIQLKAVMRADLAVWTPITLPPTITTNTAAANSNIVNQKLTFQSGFYVVSMRHVGNYRAPTADAWCTVIEASPNQVATNAQ